MCTEEESAVKKASSVGVARSNGLEARAQASHSQTAGVQEAGSREAGGEESQANGARSLSEVEDLVALLSLF